MPVFLQILYQSLVPSNITRPYSLSPNITYFGQKQLIKVQIFETQKYLDQNSLRSGHFWNKTSVHHSSVSWDITPLYFFCWNFKYFQQKESISSHVLCYGHVQKWVINNSFALYGGGFICASHTNKTEYQWTHSQWTEWSGYITGAGVDFPFLRGKKSNTLVLLNDIIFNLIFLAE